MQKQRIFRTRLLVFSMLPLVIAGVTIRPHASPRPVFRMSTLQDQMFQDLQNLSKQMSVDHTVHWKHTASGDGEVTTSMSVSATNFDGCSVVWSQTQEGTNPGELFYIETHRFEVPLAKMDAKQITVQPVGAGQSARPGIEPGDYYSVLLHSLGGKNSVNMLEHNISFDQKAGPAATVEQQKVSSAWVRVVHEEQGEILKKDFQKAIASCIAAGQ
jgi:hypothetical protein